MDRLHENVSICHRIDSSRDTGRASSQSRRLYGFGFTQLPNGASRESYHFAVTITKSGGFNGVVNVPSRTVGTGSSPASEGCIAVKLDDYNKLRDFLDKWGRGKLVSQ